MSEGVASCLSAISICSDGTAMDANSCSSCWIIGVDSTLSIVDSSVFWIAEVRF
jgi:hypothetical protein